MAQDPIKIKASRKGSLHSALGIPANDMIPTSVINAKLAGNPSPAMKKKLVFAKNARQWNK